MRDIKVEINSDQKVKFCFELLETGEIFMFDGLFYMRISDEEGNLKKEDGVIVNAFCLTTSCLCYFGIREKGNTNFRRYDSGDKITIPPFDL